MIRLGFISGGSSSVSRNTATAKTNPASSKDAAANRQQAAGGAGTNPPAADAIVGNKNSHIYHLPGCPDYEKVSPKNRVEFQSAKDAEAQGYRLAGNCRQK